jgi:peptidoglycan L-alanyl-D-glutamate endopeptidase CwlK
MPKFGKTSTERLSTCHILIQNVMNEVINHWDCTIIEGYRDQETQDRYFAEGKSKLMYPNGYHNRKPAQAVDVMPYHPERPHIHWNDKLEAIRFASFVQGVAAGMGVKLVWGGDWDHDWNTEEQQWNDWPHFRLEI